jgi:hypothetical protein
MYGIFEVHKMVKRRKRQKTALNDFMKQVLGSIDNKIYAS